MYSILRMICVSCGETVSPTTKYDSVVLLILRMDATSQILRSGIRRYSRIVSVGSSPNVRASFGVDVVGVNRLPLLTRPLHHL